MADGTYGELLNDVIEPVTFARSAGPGSDVRTIHKIIYIHIILYIYIYRTIAQHGTASVGLAQAGPNYSVDTGEEGKEWKDELFRPDNRVIIAIPSPGGLRFAIIPSLASQPYFFWRGNGKIGGKRKMRREKYIRIFPFSSAFSVRSRENTAAGLARLRHPYILRVYRLSDVAV